jgi:hypothetical protein
MALDLLKSTLEQQRVVVDRTVARLVIRSWA